MPEYQRRVGFLVIALDGGGKRSDCADSNASYSILIRSFAVATSATRNRTALPILKYPSFPMALPHDRKRASKHPFPMNSPIPANDTQPLRVGDLVRIAPQFQDPGDDEFERVVIEAPGDSTRVMVETRIPGLTYSPTERIEARMLERV
jgi:hypothetical protein